MTVSKLYQLTDHYNAARAMLDEDIINYTQESVQQILANIKDDFDEKVSSIGKLVLELRASAEAIKAEEERLAKRRSAFTNKMEWLKTYLLSEMQTANILKVKKDVLTVSVQNNPPSAVLVDIKLVPETYIRVIPEAKELNKLAVIEHFKEAGEIVSGVEVVTNKKFVSIR